MVVPLPVAFPPRVIAPPPGLSSLSLFSAARKSPRLYPPPCPAATRLGPRQTSPPAPLSQGEGSIPLTPLAHRSGGGAGVRATSQRAFNAHHSDLLCRLLPSSRSSSALAIVRLSDGRSRPSPCGGPARGRAPTGLLISGRSGRAGMQRGRHFPRAA